jgi:hypothetical protein
MRRALTARLLALAFGCICMCGTGSAYYYFTYFNSNSPPYTPVPAKFNLKWLPNNTIQFYVSDQQPDVLYPGDSFPAIVSELRTAAQVWNQVSTSNLRFAYGGLFTSGVTQVSEGISVEFSDDVPPGLLALGAPTSFANLASDAQGLFVPIFQSRILLPRDMSQIPSYSEQFFITLVHEFGHTLGLQHNLASSVMSTLWTSASAKEAPLSADDIAAVSMLYPASKYLASVGSVSGRVTMNGTGLNLASVVVISPSNPAISTLTNLDGTYQINGIPPGQYFVYVHPLPPPVRGESTPDNIFYPHNLAGSFIGPNYTAFATQFYPNTRDAQQAQSIFVTAGKISGGINFAVNARSSVAVSSVRTYGFSPTNVPVPSGPLFVGMTAPLAATGVGLMDSHNVVTPGLNVQMLGAAAWISDLRPYPPPTPYIAVDVLVSFLAPPGAKHLLFYTPDDLYVLPAGFKVVKTPPPGITSVTAVMDGTGNRAALVAGTTFEPDTTILFDGLPGVIEGVQSDGSLLVLPPPGPGSYVASVAALNSDGQSSLYFSQTPPTFTYDPASAPLLTVMPSILSPGADMIVDVQGVNTNFIAGQTVVGFGTFDVTVKQVSILSPTHLTALVTPNTTISAAAINVTTGLGIVSGSLGYQVAATDPPSH